MLRSRRGAALVTLGTFAWAIAQWYLVWLFARHAGGADAVGVYSSLIATATPLFVIGQLGLRTVYLTLNQEWPWRTYAWLRVIGVAGVGTIMAGLLIWHGGYSFALGAGIITLKCADSALDLLMSRIQRSGRLSLLGSLTLANSVGTAALASAVVLVTGSMAATLFASAAVSIGICLLAWRLCPITHTESEALGSGIVPILRAGLPVMVSQGLAAVSAYLPVLLLSKWSSPSVVGVYAAAAYLLTATNLVGASTQTVLIPTFRRALERAGCSHVHSSAIRLASIYIAVGALAGVAVVSFGSSVLITIYGSSFEMSRNSLLLLSLAALAVPPSYIFSVVLCVLNRYKTEVFIWLIAVLAASLAGLRLFAAGFDPLNVGLSVAATIAWTRLGGVAVLSAIGCRRDARASGPTIARGESLGPGRNRHPKWGIPEPDTVQRLMGD